MAKTSKYERRVRVKTANKKRRGKYLRGELSGNGDINEEIRTIIESHPKNNFCFCPFCSFYCTIPIHTSLHIINCHPSILSRFLSEVMQLNKSEEIIEQNKKKIMNKVIKHFVSFIIYTYNSHLSYRDKSFFLLLSYPNGLKIFKFITDNAKEFNSLFQQRLRKVSKDFPFVRMIQAVEREKEKRSLFSSSIKEIINQYEQHSNSIEQKNCFVINTCLMKLVEIMKETERRFSEIKELKEEEKKEYENEIENWHQKYLQLQEQLYDYREKIEEINVIVKKEAIIDKEINQLETDIEFFKEAETVTDSWIRAKPKLIQSNNTASQKINEEQVCGIVV